VLAGTGYIPRGPETQIYSIENTGPEPGRHGRNHARRNDWPARRLTPSAAESSSGGISHCFRTEAGAQGRATRGLYRVHQFTKVEMFALHGAGCERCDARTPPRPGVPAVRRSWGSYRVVDTAKRATWAARPIANYDLEAMDAGRGEFGEVTSTSNCTDFQAGRLNIPHSRG